MTTIKENRKYLPRNYAKTVAEALKLSSVTKIYKVAQGKAADWSIEEELWRLIQKNKAAEKTINSIRNSLN